MKPCHAAALALVGWYLMVPPYGSYHKPPLGRFTVYTDAPLAEWTVDSGYDKADECNKVQQTFQARGAPDERKYKLGSEYWAVVASLSFAQCIASDDPRLKGK
jgi:hypothetical protein